MAKRKFQLPGIQDLSKEQEDARALPKKGQHLIIGGPGTGKSVLALLRCRRHSLDNDDYIFLVYNHLLNQASRQLSGVNLTSQTWISWFKQTFCTMTGESTPLKPPEKKPWDIDWEGVLEMIYKLEPLTEGDRPYLIIDEGQDMPPQFYQALANLGFENFYVVADQNQQIEPGKNCSRQEIQDALAIDRNNVIELRYNYRNTYPIARLAQEFYTGDPASPPPQLPGQENSAIKPILFEYGANDKKSFKIVIERILKIADTDSTKLIGIITPDNNVRERYYNHLTSINVALDNGRPHVITYQNGYDPKKLIFNEGGIMVINTKSCKGLEFDTVFIADIDKYRCWPAILDEKKKLFYVMVARAIDRIILLKEAGKHCPVNEILPNENVLERI